MKIISILVASAAAAAIGFADAKFTRGSFYKTKEHADRHHLDSTELSMPGQMKDSPGDNAGIAELLADDGVSKDVVSGFLFALDTKMSSGPARDVCTTLLDEILDIFLFSREVEEAIKIILCGEDEEIASTSIPSQSPSEGPTVTGQCQDDKNCGLGQYCSPGGPPRKCAFCECFRGSGGTTRTCTSEEQCDSPYECKAVRLNKACPNMAIGSCQFDFDCDNGQSCTSAGQCE